MAENTDISWADDTFNPWEGCQKVGPGCDNCYAETRNARYGGGVAANWGPGAPRRRTSEANWRKPLKWNREARASGQPRFVFCASLADVFDNAVPTSWRADLFDLIRATPHLTWLLLTKRPGNIVKMFTDIAGLGPYEDEDGLRSQWPRNAAIGCTVVNQDEANRDVKVLLAAGHALRPAFTFLSIEPMLGPIDLVTAHKRSIGHGKIGWVIVGGESGANARPLNPAWVEDIEIQCEEAGVPMHFKQWGAWVNVNPTSIQEANDHARFRFIAPGVYMKKVGAKAAGRTLGGKIHDARPKVAA